MTEYNPLNERLKKQYEEGLLHAKYLDPRTVDSVWKSINLFEEYTGKKDLPSFNAEQAKAFKRWLSKKENDKGILLSISTVRSTLKHLREFFTWLAIHPKYIRKVNSHDALYLRLSDNDERAGRATKEKPIPTVEEVRKALMAMPYKTDIEKRDRAIMAFMALAYVRDGALVTLKIKDINRAKKEIWQNPKHVKTKKRKAIPTYFMPFDPLWEEIFIDWLDYVENDLKFKPNDPLFPKSRVKNNPETFTVEEVVLTREHWASASPVRKIFKTAFEAVGLPYYHPHSFRNMLSIWAMENCNQIEFKAISQNIGHEHSATTYNAYGKLNDHKRKSVINNIGMGNNELGHVPDSVIMAEMQRRLSSK